jgi:phosphoribosylaminoimidazole carboxylase PurE protein
VTDIKNKHALVGIVMGSASDGEIMSVAKKMLDDFGIPVEMRILSAHRTPDEVTQWASRARESGIKVIIAAAGLAAHLAGVTSAHTILPVIGVPMEGGPLKGLDALLSTVQMPKGTPVATVAIGNPGAINAALLALRILGLGDAELQNKLEDYQRQIAEEVLKSDKELQAKIG